MSNPETDTRFRLGGNRRWRLVAVAIAIALAVVATACGSDGTTEAADSVDESAGDDSAAVDVDEPDAAEEPAADTSDEPGAADQADAADTDAGATDDTTPDDSVDSTAADPEVVAGIGTDLSANDIAAPGTWLVDVITDDWQVTTESELIIYRSDEVLLDFSTGELADTDTQLAMLKTVGIVPPREASVHQEHDPIVPEVTIDLPTDLQEWFDAVPQLVVTDTGTSTVAGQPATWHRLTVDPTAGGTFHCPFGDNCIGFIVHEIFGVTVLSPEIDVTVWQMEAIPDVIPWVQTKGPERHEAAQEAMAELLAGIAAA